MNFIPVWEIFDEKIIIVFLSINNHLCILAYHIVQNIQGLKLSQLDHLVSILGKIFAVTSKTFSSLSLHLKIHGQNIRVSLEYFVLHSIIVRILAISVNSSGL